MNTSSGQTLTPTEATDKPVPPNYGATEANCINILAVDDEPDLAVLLQKKFRRAIKKGQLSFQFATNGKEALELLENANTNFQILLTDINMPIMDGLTLLSHINERWKTLKTIIISAYGDLDNIRAAMNMGAFDFLTKPLDLQDLQITLDKAIASSRLIAKGIESSQKLAIAEKKRMEAEASKHFKEQFLANMSHEIRTPLNAIVGMTQLLLNKNPRAEQLDYLQKIERASDNLMHIINDILDLSKIEAGKIVIDAQAFSPQRNVEQVVELLRIKANEKGIAINTHINDKLPKVVVGDAYRLQQILVNLLGNAIKFTQNGSVNITATLANEQDNTQTIHFAVSDTGIGISDEQQQHIFESFAQAESGIAKKYGGTGLGLAISKELVHLQKGTMALESSLGKGSTFSFSIPYRKATEAEIAELLPQLAADLPKYTNIKDLPPLPKKVKVLLVEDNNFNQQVAIDTLKMLQNDIVIRLAENGQEAIDILQAKQQTFDFVLMDLQMPVMDGYEATKRIRQLENEPALAQIPIIALTASATPAEIARCKAVGMDYHLSKPFMPHQIHSIINDVIAKKQSGQPHSTAFGHFNEDAALTQNNTPQKAAQAPATEANNITTTEEPILNAPEPSVQFNLAMMQTLAKGDKGKLKNYLKIFVENVPVLLKQLQAAKQTHTATDMRRSAHTLKSQFRYIGASSLQEIAYIIERYAQYNTIPKATEQHIEDVITYAKLLVEKIQQEMQKL